MNDKTNQAALDPLDAFVGEVLDQDSEQTTEEIKPTESATVEKEEAPKEPVTEGDKPESDGFQKRIDKVTADKYAEKRRADALQKKIDALEKANQKETLVKPKLEDHDYDEEAFNAANRDYDVKLGVQEALSKQEQDAKAEQQKQESEKVLATFDEGVKALAKEDFNEKTALIPILPNGVADAIMQTENGAELAYYLGTNLDKADAIASMTPMNALMELGKLSVKLAAKPEIKQSAAPEPIETLKAGSALSSSIDDDMPIDKWMAKYG